MRVNASVMQWVSAIPEEMFAGNSPDLTVFTGNSVAEKLWEPRKADWTSSAFKTKIEGCLASLPSNLYGIG